MPGRIYLIVGPSATGKTTVVNELVKQKDLNLFEAVSHTTRPMRPGEVEGETYYFVSDPIFEAMLRTGWFAESVVYPGSGFKYGISKPELDKQLKRGDVLLIVEGHGAEQIKRLYPDAFVFFMLPPHHDELKRRMQERGDSPEVIARRILSIGKELDWLGLADQIVPPRTNEESCALIRSVILRNQITSLV